MAEGKIQNREEEGEIKVEDEEEEMRQDLAMLLLQVWHSINWDKISASRRMRIYDEFSSKILSASHTSDMKKFLESLCRKWGIRSLPDPYIIEILNKYEDRDMLKSLREETIYLVLLMRSMIEEHKSQKGGQQWLKI